MGRVLRIIGTSFALTFTLAAIIITIVLGYPQSISKHGISDFQYLALIDVSNLHTQVGATNYQGLPDSHDFSKHKDFFTLYVHRYCSGQKDPKTGAYTVDFCSDIGRELFDQYRVWKVWGVDLATPRKKDTRPKLARRDYDLWRRRSEDTTNGEKYDENVIQKSIGVSDIRTMPRVVFGAFFATAVLSGLTLIWVLISYCTSFAKWAAVISSALATVAALITATCTQILFPTLVNRIHNYPVVVKNNAGGGVLGAKLGIKAVAGLWTLALLSLFATMFLAMTLHSHRKEQAKKNGKRHSIDRDSRLKEYQLSPTTGSSKVPTVAVRKADSFPGIIRRTTEKMFGNVGLSRYDDTSYETLRVVGGEPRGRSRSPARPSDLSRSRAGTIEESEEVSNKSEEKTGSRYERYRPHAGS